MRVLLFLAQRIEPVGYAGCRFFPIAKMLLQQVRVPGTDLARRAVKLKYKLADRTFVEYRVLTDQLVVICTPSAGCPRGILHTATVAIVPPTLFSKRQTLLCIKVHCHFPKSWFYR